MTRIFLAVLILAAACAADPAAPGPSEPVGVPEETARTAVTAANEASLFIGKLHWGRDPATGKPWTVETLRRLRGEPKGRLSRHVRGVMTKAEQALKAPPKVVSGDHLFHFAFCARVATDAVQTACKASFRAAYFGTDEAMGLIKRLKPIDYPVEQAAQFSTLLRGVDLFFPLMTLDEKSETRVWLHAFAEQDAGRRPEAWRLATKMTAAVLLEDERQQQQIQELARRKVGFDFLPPDGWKPDPTCRNNRAEKLYGSHDFRRRDALLFHVYNLQAWTTVLGAKPGTFDAAGQTAFVRAMEFLKPYYTGRKFHREFVCTAVAADRDRAKAGQREYQQKRWRRDGARTLLRTAEPFVPAIKSWAAPALDENHSPALKLVASLQSGR